MNKPTNKIKKRRLELGLSQSDLSLKAGVPAFIIQRYEQERASRKPINYALKIAEALDADVEFLFS